MLRNLAHIHLNDIHNNVYAAACVFAQFSMILLWLVVWNMFIFPYIENSHPNWLSCFSEGLKPPTSTCGLVVNEHVFFMCCTGVVPSRTLQQRSRLESVLSQASDGSFTSSCLSAKVKAKGHLFRWRFFCWNPDDPWCWYMNPYKTGSFMGFLCRYIYQHHGWSGKYIYIYYLDKLEGPHCDLTGNHG